MVSSCVFSQMVTKQISFLKPGNYAIKMLKCMALSPQLIHTRLFLNSLFILLHLCDYRIIQCFVTIPPPTFPLFAEISVVSLLRKFTLSMSQLVIFEEADDALLSTVNPPTK